MDKFNQAEMKCFNEDLSYAGLITIGGDKFNRNILNAPKIKFKVMHRPIIPLNNTQIGCSLCDAEIKANYQIESSEDSSCE